MLSRLFLVVSYVACVLADDDFFGVPENDKCIQSYALDPYVPVFGNNTLANFDYHNQGVCGPRSDRAAMWYRVIGRGAEVTVSVCTNNDVITDFGVFRECNEQNCLGFPEQTFEPANCDEDEAKELSFVAADGEKYYVHVRSDVIDGIGSNFTIVYTDESLDGPLSDPPTSSPTREEDRNGGDSGSKLTFLMATWLGAATLLTLC